MSTRPKAPKYTFWRGGVLWARFAVGGREHRESLRTSKVEVARSRVAVMRDRAIGAESYGENRRTYSQVYLEWTEHMAKQVSAKTAKRYDVSLGQIEEKLKDRFIDEIAKADVLAIVKERRKKVTNATIRRDLQALSSLLQFAELHDWRIGNPAKLIMETLSERRDPIMLPLETDYKIMRARLAKNSPMIEALMVAARATGARISELTSVQRSWLNPKARTLTVIGKRNKRRTVELDAETTSLLERLPAALDTKLMFFYSTPEGSRPLSNASFVFSKATRAAQKAAQEKKFDFTGFRFHDLRHWFAVEWLKAGRSIYDLQQHLGHTSVSTTEIYLEFLTVEEAEKAKRPAETALAKAATGV